MAKTEKPRPATPGQGPTAAELAAKVRAGLAEPCDDCPNAPQAPACLNCRAESSGLAPLAELLARLEAAEAGLRAADAIQFPHNKRCPCDFCRQIAHYRAARKAGTAL